MEFKKCNRCGNFYVSEGQVCSKCAPKENCEYSTFKSYVEENGIDTQINNMAGQTGISPKNLNRFIESDGLNLPVEEIGKKTLGLNGITFN